MLNPRSASFLRSRVQHSRTVATFPVWRFLCHPLRRFTSDVGNSHSTTNTSEHLATNTDTDTNTTTSSGSTTSETKIEVVYPEGRPEIAELTRRMLENRIKSGHSGRRQHNQQQTLDTRDGALGAGVNARSGDSPLRSAAAARKRGSSTAATTTSSSPNPHLHKLPRDADGEVLLTEVPLWKKHREAIKAKTGGQVWNPQRKLSRQAMEEVRYLRKQFPEEWTTAKLADHFNVAGESIAKILRTNYQPTVERAAQQDATRQRHRQENIAADVTRIKSERTATRDAQKQEREDARRKERAEQAAARFEQRVQRQGQVQGQGQGFRRNDEYRALKERVTSASSSRTMPVEEFERLKKEKHEAWLARQAERKMKRSTEPTNEILLGAPKGK
ncbi:MAG: Neugrin-domain-containing protein [Linnemannia gamsii]|nr:MAG: Neugrin-domain-containing protein [Linnemannia gamsii]